MRKAELGKKAKSVVGVPRFVAQAHDRLREADYAEARTKWKDCDAVLDGLLTRARRSVEASRKLGVELDKLLRLTGNHSLLTRKNRFQVADFPPDRLRRPRLKREPA